MRTNWHTLLAALLGFMYTSSSFSQVNLSSEMKGFNDYSHTKGLTEPSAIWSIQKRPYVPIRTKQPRFFPVNHWSVGGYAYQLNGQTLFTFRGKAGCVTISSTDSLRYAYHNDPLTRPQKVVETSNTQWMLADGKLLHISPTDTAEYAILKHGEAATIEDIFSANKGVWVKTPYDVYLIGESGGVRLVADGSMRTSKLFQASSNEVVAFLKNETVRYSCRGMELTDKQTSKVYHSYINGMSRCSPCPLYSGHYAYSSYIITANKDSSMVYFLSDGGDYQVKLDFSKVVGVDEAGNIWYTCYKNKCYYLSYIEKGWEEKLRRNEQLVLVDASNFTATWGEEYDLDYSNIITCNDGSLYIVTYFGGIIKYKNGEYKMLPGVDGSKFTSIFKLLELSPSDYLYNLPVKLWSDQVWSRMAIGKNGIGYNFYNTNKDSQGNSWRTEKGVLYNDTQGISLAIKAALDSSKIKMVEEYTMQSFWLLNRLFINKNDVIYIFGKKSVVTYNIKSKRWALHPTDKNGEISYQRIYQDSDGNVWFEVENVGISHLDRTGLKKLNLPARNPDYWQVDNASRLILIQGGTLYCYQLGSLNGGTPKLLRKFPLDPSIYSLNRIKTILTKDNHILIVNSEGYYIFD